MRVFLAKLAKDEAGQDLIEYALVAALIGLGAVSTLKGVKNAIASDFNDVGNQLTNAV
jgi:pilus assembly protein Flp/PilA